MRKSKFNPFKFKVIETRYDGYHFRSRLEARWALFFNELGIKYEYEKEGYDLEGTWYLPDFWLPEHNCFIEIKGQEPTEEEIKKAQLLTLYTQKGMGMFYSNIQPPKLTAGKENSLYFRPVLLWTYPLTEKLGGPSTRIVPIPSYILALYQKLHENGLDLYVHSDGELAIAPKSTPYAMDSIDSLISFIKFQERVLLETQDILLTHEDEIRMALTPQDGWNIDITMQFNDLEDECLWGECNKCGAIQLSTLFSNLHKCKDQTVGNLLFNTPRLLAAFTAARETRF